MYWFGLNFKYAINRFKEFNAYLIPKVEKIITVFGTIEEIRTFYSLLFFYKKYYIHDTATNFFRFVAHIT